MNHNPVLHFTDIQGILPHRYPMLLVDAVCLLEPDVSIVAIKCVTGNESCYAGLPNDTDMRRLAYPYSLIIESCGQAGGVLWIVSARLAGRDVKGLPVFVSAKECFFESDALPGDVMEHRVRLERVIADTIFMSGETWVGKRRIARMGWLTAVARPAESLIEQREAYK
jgi:3-hydroxyacyl-[acyl-carrier-protein] dehydratase